MKKIISLFMTLIALIDVQSQNFVKNGNFEQLTVDSVSNWETIAGSPDIINLNNLSKDYHWETNKRFFKGVEGRGFVGYAFDDKDSEVLGTNLLSSLENDSVYTISAKILAGHSCLSGFEMMTVGLTTEEIEKSNHPRNYEINVSELTNKTNYIKGGEWTDLIGKYKSIGDEKYLYLGNFNRANRKYSRGARDIILEDEKLNSCTYLIIGEIKIIKGSPSEDDRMDIIQPLFTIEDVVFEFGRWDIKTTHYEELNEIVKLLKTRNDIITITGHTDNIGTVESNKILSTNRANAVKEYFVKHGLNKDKLKVSGKGE